MSIRSSLLAAAFTLTTLAAAHANGLRPIEAQSINLGDMSGVAYYTVEPDGFRVVTTLAQGEAGTPIRPLVVDRVCPSLRLSEQAAPPVVKNTNRGSATRLSHGVEFKRLSADSLESVSC